MGLADRAIKVSRRGMLQTGAVTAVIYATSSGTCLFPVADNAWAAESRGLSQQERATLVRFTRDLFPHDQLVDAFYANAIAPLDAEAAKDPVARAKRFTARWVQHGLSPRPRPPRRTIWARTACRRSRATAS